MYRKCVANDLTNQATHGPELRVRLKGETKRLESAHEEFAAQLPTEFSASEQADEE